MTLDLHILLLLLAFSCWMPNVSYGQAQDLTTDSRGEPFDEDHDDDALPSILDRDYIAYFFAEGLDDLYDVLHFVFERSLRMPTNDDEDDKEEALPKVNLLPDRLIHRGSGSSFTTRAKLVMDLEQSLYLASTLTDETEATFFKEIAAPIYKEILDNIPTSYNDTTIYFFTEHDYENVLIDLVYNRAWHPTSMEPEVDESIRNVVPLLNPLDKNSIVQQWKDGQGVVVLDDFLSSEALLKVQQLLRESTVWYEANNVVGSYTSAAYLDDGLFDKLLLQLSYETKNALVPIVIPEGYALHDLWARRYDLPVPNASTPGNDHEDELTASFVEVGDPFAAVHVHLWISPCNTVTKASSITAKTTTNTDDETGHGDLVVFTAKPPKDWPWTMGPTGSEVMESILRPSGFANVTVSYHCNRVVVFDAGLFYKTSSGSTNHVYDSNLQEEDAIMRYERRLTDLTLLYGDSFDANDDDSETDEL